MSLNHCEQMVLDYVQAHVDERQYWFDKVRKTSSAAEDLHSAAFRLEGELWRYFEERSAVASPFREEAERHGVKRMSMKNLAEYMLRLWAPPREKKPGPKAAG